MLSIKADCAGRGLAGFGAAAVFVLGLAAAGPALAQGAPQVTVAKPLVRQVVEDDEFVGRFAAVNDVEVRARISGYLEKSTFQDGAMVKKGDPLFVIDQRPFKLRLTQAEARIENAKSVIDFAEAQYDRAEKLLQRGNIAAATRDSRWQALISARTEMTTARAALDQAKIDFSWTDIRAPISGRIDRRYVAPGNLVEADQTVLTRIVSLDPIYFYFDIDERSYLAYARDAAARGGTLQEGAGGLKVRIRLGDAQETTVEGALDFAENRIDPASGTMRVRAKVPNGNFLIYPGLFGRVNVPGSLPYRGVLVPDEAVAADQDRRIVWTLDADNVVHAKVVRPGPRLDGYRVIREGLTGEETVVVNGLMRIRPGAKVTPEMIELPPKAEGAPGR